MDRFFTGGLEKVIIPGTGHFMHQEKPLEVNPRIVEFLMRYRVDTWQPILERRAGMVSRAITHADSTTYVVEDTLGFQSELFQYKLIGGECQRLWQGIQGEIVSLVQVVSGP